MENVLQQESDWGTSQANQIHLHTKFTQGSSFKAKMARAASNEHQPQSLFSELWLSSSVALLSPLTSPKPRGKPCAAMDWDGAPLSWSRVHIRKHLHQSSNPLFDPTIGTFGFPLNPDTCGQMICLSLHRKSWLHLAKITRESTHTCW